VLFANLWVLYLLEKSNDMKIAYVANIRFPTEKAHGVQIAKACEALAKQDSDLTLLVPARRTHITEPALAYYGIKHSFLIRTLTTLDWLFLGTLGFWIQSWTFALSTLYYLRAHPFDVVYGRDELVLCVLYMGGVRNIFWESHDGTWNICSRYIAKRARGIVIVSNGLRDFYATKGIAREKLCAVPNGITLADFSLPESREVSRERLHLPHGTNIALYIGRLDGWKGTNALLEASNLLPADIRVALIGGEQHQIDILKKKYPQALFLGYRPYSELPNNQAAADVLVVPNTAKDDVSVRFTSPLKLIAHMASRRPIVASDLPSIRELVDDSCAVLVQPDNPHALAEGIQHALGDAARAEAAYARVQALDWSARATRILAFVKEKLLTTGI
jgi:glycosyltransferase involved in cell wall biosynthesis